MRIFIVTRDTLDNGIIVNQKIRGITDSDNILKFSQDDFTIFMMILICLYMSWHYRIMMLRKLQSLILWTK